MSSSRDMSSFRDRREYGLTEDDRAWLIARKFAPEDAVRVRALLDAVPQPTPQVLGAILFLARPGRVDDVVECVRLAAEDRAALLDAATVKDERG